MQRLPTFLRESTEEILNEWEQFARSLSVCATMDIAALRDHAMEMLTVIATDLETPQTPEEQTDKAEGKTDAVETGPPATAAQEHGAARAASGFSVAEMVSELRALRATVIRLWTRHDALLGPQDVEDMIRFNEAIDQAIAESVTQHSEELGQTKDRFLAILGHDLRNPLGAIIMSASFMLELEELGEPHRNLITRIERSARRMNGLIGDLLDYTRIELGGNAIPVLPAPMDLTRMVQDVAAEVGTRYPKSTVKVDVDGDLRGKWDCARLTQALTNLVSNAVQHGAKDSPIAVAAHGTATEVAISVQNEGAAIPKADLGRLFKVGAYPGSDRASADEHLGLGLFIVDRIVAAHGGTVDVDSTRENGTTFTIHLPRAA